MAVLYNVIQETTEARELYRDEDAVHVFARFRLNTNDSVSCQALILQAYVINEDENDVLGSDDRCFQFLGHELSSAVNSTDSRSLNGYRTVELLAAINKLSVHDDNKRRIIDSGVLTSYTRLLSSGHSVSEQLLTTQGLWTLAMDCPQDVAKQDGCIQSLQQLLTDSEEDLLRRQVRGVLKAVGTIKDQTQRPVSASSHAQPRTSVTAAAGGGISSSSSSGDTKHIFISYNHGSKKTVLRLRDQLKAAGFVVWVDEEGVYESIADDIITGLDSAQVVLVCMSQKYYESPYCKKELVYAAESYKKIIPLTIEPRYNPHGWLRFHTSDGLRYDFSSNESFEDSFKKLVYVLKKCYSSSDENVQRLEQIHSTEAAAAAAAAAKAVPHLDITPVSRDDDDAAAQVKTNTRVARDSSQSDVSSWTRDDVTRWLADNQLLSLQNWFAGFDGDLLLEYKSHRHSSSQCLAACVSDELQQARLSLADVMRLNKALRQL